MYSAVLKRDSLRRHGGHIFSQRRLRSTRWPPGRSMGVVNSGNAPGLNSRPSAWGPSVRGQQTAAFGGITRGFRAAQGEPLQTRLGPWLPRSPGPLEHPLRPSLSLVELRHLFGTCFWGPQGGICTQGAKTMIPHAQGGTRGVWDSKGAVQGPPMDPSDGPIARLVERDT